MFGVLSRGLKEVLDTGLENYGFLYKIIRTCVSRIACNLHLINSVGQSGKEEKKAAKKPALAFWSSDKSLMDSLPEALATSF